MTINVVGFLLFLFFSSGSTFAQMNHAEHKSQPAALDHVPPEKEMKSSSAPIQSHSGSMKMPMGPMDCSEMQLWDYEMGMCMPTPMPEMPMTMVMVHGNAFGVGITEQGPRGRREITSQNMIMADIGRQFGDSHYVNLDVMATIEKWTFPENGYPELLQIGETNSQGVPYLDAQHPHNSPIMGLTLSDTIRLGASGNSLKLFFAPRGSSTDGPIPFMHRPTGMANPDAPLGHHIGQDVGHISSTVIGGSIKLSQLRIEASAFNGTEPVPTEVSLPFGAPSSGALRLIYEFTPKFQAMASIAYVRDPEPLQPDIPFEVRHSLSAYFQHAVFGEWMLHHAFIHGAVSNYDRASMLNSFDYEFWLHDDHHRLWGRAELLQRTPAELQVGASDPNGGQWVAALTLGATHRFLTVAGVDLSAGISGTKDLLPAEFIGAYGGNPWTGKIFVQLSGMGMWNW